MRTRTVITADGIKLHVVEEGDPKKPGILFLHGFPDCHRVWEHQLRALARSYHVIAFDMRGCGKSTQPLGRQAWRMDALLPDIAAVITATRGKAGRVHLVGHDWGSVIGWSFVADAHYAKYILSWTSLSGPHIALAWQWISDRLRSGNLQQWGEVAAQVASSWYIFALNVPGLGRALFRFAGVELWRHVMQLGGVPADDPYLQVSQQEVEARALGPISLYQQNALSPPPAPQPGSIIMPVQLLVARHDRFLRPPLFSELNSICSNLVRVDLNANHWAQRSNAAEVTVLIREFVKRNSKKPTPSKALAAKNSRRVKGRAAPATR